MHFGPYRIVGLLGQGGMGVVHLAIDPSGRDVALKVVQPDLSADPEVRGRFQREIRLARRLTHPHVVRTLDSGEVGGQLFMSSELVRGGSLAKALSTRGRLAEAQALYVFRDIAAGLDGIAQAGMLHRDLKPDNILLEPGGAAKISDLGLARTTAADRTRYTADGQIIGTPAYLAPEQIDGLSALDTRCDLYAAGAVLYELLAGRPPFRGANVIQTLNMHLGKPAPDVRELAPGVRPEVAALVAALLEKDRERRPASAAAVVALVDRLLEGAPPREALGAATGPAPHVPLFGDDGRTIASAGTEGVSGGAGAGETAEGEENILGGGTLFRTGIERPATLEQLPLEGAILSPNAHLARNEPTQRFDVITFGAGPADPSRATFTGRETLLRADPAEGAATLDFAGGLDRAKLVLSLEGRPPRTLFVYGGAQLRLGRDGIDRGGVDVCLRLRPTAGNEAATRSISGRHFRLSVHEGAARIADAGSTGGTALDGRRLPPDVAEVLPARAEVNLAGALRLGLSVVRAQGAAEPSVWIERLSNAPEHAYALVPDRLALSLGDGALAPAESGPLEIVRIGAALAARLPGEGTAPLREGLALAVAGGAIAVSSILPEDQK